MIRGLFKLLTRLVILVTVIFCVGFAWMRWGEPSIVTETRVTVTSSTLPETADGLRVAHFTDTHFGFDYTAARFSRAVEKINDFQPNIVVFTGDLYEEYSKYPADDEAIIDALLSIRATYGKYAVLGNHDYGRGEKSDSVRILEAGGFTVLENESEVFPLLGVTLTGIDDMFFGKGNSFDLGALGADTYNLVLCHEPDIFADAGNSNLDLLLSGHTHGGQVRLPYFGELILPAMGRLYPMGQYFARNTRGSELFVSRGLGTSKMPIRLFCAPEVALITLKRG